MYKLKKIIPYLLIIAISFAVAAGAYYKLETVSAENQPTGISYLVPNRNISAYEHIKEADLSFKNFPVEMPGAITNSDEVVGKVTKYPLAEGWPIDKSKLTDPENIDNRQLVTIFVDYARSGGATSGDIVDVYKVYPEDSARKVERVAQNARVMSLTNSKGRTSGQTEAGAFSIGSENIDIETVRLAVKPEEVPRLVSGALANNANYVLVVKHKETNEPLQNIIIEGDDNVKEGPEQNN